MGGTGIENVFSLSYRAVLAEKLDFAPPFYAKEDAGLHKGEWKDVAYLFSTWAAPELQSEELAEYFPNLKAVFYAAGSVQYFARPFLKRGARVFTANEALSLPVVEFAAAQIFLANKGYFQAQRLYHDGSWDKAKKYCAMFPGNEGTAVGILGAGRIGSGVICKLREGRVKVNVFDPFLSAENAVKLGAEKADTLEELFSSSFVISNHLANNEQTKGMLQYRHFTLMHDYGTFINTGRGAQLDENGLARALKEKPHRTALLDVTWPEPIQPDHPFCGMDNVLLSPHIGGPTGNELIWMGEYITKEFLSFISNGPLRSEVTEEMLATMA
jgi:phosphoglycerate dehydrogenase-like enzyme